MVNQALQRELLGGPAAGGPETPVFRGGTGPAPGVELRSNAALYDLLDEDLPQRQRR